MIKAYKVLKYMILVSISLLIQSALATPTDSSGVTVYKNTPQILKTSIDYNNCTNPQSGSWEMYMGRSGYGSGDWQYHNYDPGRCPDNYAMVDTNLQMWAYGIYNSGTYLVFRSIQFNTAYICCPVISSWGNAP